MCFWQVKKSPNGRLEIVVTDTLRYALKKSESLHVPHEEGFLLLAGKSHHKGAPRVGQFHKEELDVDCLAVHDDLSYAPIHLGVGAGVEFQRQVEAGLFVQFAHLRHVT